MLGYRKVLSKPLIQAATDWELSLEDLIPGCGDCRRLRLQRENETRMQLQERVAREAYNQSVCIRQGTLMYFDDCISRYGSHAFCIMSCNKRQLRDFGDSL